MKRYFTSAILFLLINFIVSAGYIRISGNPFFSFEIDGKYGIMCKDRIALYPQYDELKSIYNAREKKWNHDVFLNNEICLFGYRINDKWGILDGYSRLTPPIYDDVLLLGDDFMDTYVFIFVKKGDKWCMLNQNGKEAFEPILDEVITTFSQYNDISKKSNSYGNSNVKCFYVLGRIDNHLAVIALDGMIIVDKIKDSDKAPFYIIENLKNPISKAEKSRHKLSGWSDDEINRHQTLKENVCSMWKSYGIVRQRLSSLKNTRNIPAPQMNSNSEKFGLYDNGGVQIVPEILDSIGNFENCQVAPFRHSDETGYITRLGVLIYNDEFEEPQINGYSTNFYTICSSIDGLFNNNNYVEALYLYRSLKEIMDDWVIDMPEARNMLNHRISESEHEIWRMNEQKKRQRQTEQFRAILGAIQNTVAVLSSQISSYGSENIIRSPESVANGSSNNSNYQSQYDRWAKRAEANYNSITRYSKKDEYGNTEKGSAGQSSSPATYVQQKKLYREAQNEMKRIRGEASQAGVSITPSEYENLSISY